MIHGHIVVDILSGRLSQKVKAVLTIIFFILSIVVIVLLVWVRWAQVAYIAVTPGSEHPGPEGTHAPV